MIIFVCSAVALVVVCLVLLLRPLLRREISSRAERNSAELSLAVLQDQLNDLQSEMQAGRLEANDFKREKDDIERRVLEDASAKPTVDPASPRRPWAAALIATVLIVLTATLYLVLGSPPIAPEKSAAGNHSVSPEQIKEMVQRLAERLQSNPQDGEGWLMLGRSYSVLGRYPEAAAAFGRAIGLLPPDANLLADYADILAMAQGRTLKGEPEKIIARALEVDPRHVKALALSGSVAFERQDFAKAIGEWRKILAAVPPDSPIAQSIGNSIRDAEAKLSGAAPATMPPLAAAGQDNASAGKNAEVGGTVSLAPALKDRVAAGDTVFIFARALDGSRMPLAMVRKKVADLPISFTLNDAMAMAPSARLSAHAKVKIGARVSKSGDAISAVGDLEGFSDEVELGRRDVAVTIDRVVK